MARYKAHPVPVPGRMIDDVFIRGGTNALVTSSILFGYLGYFLALADDPDFPDPGALVAIFDASNGRLPDGSYTNVLAAWLVITANDRRAPRSAAAYPLFVSDALEASPHFGPTYAVTDFLGTRLPVSADSYRGPVHNPDDAAPVLLVGATGDTATPYPWAVAMEAQLGNARLLTFDGIQHVSEAVSPCVAECIAAYFIDGTLPPPGTVCY